MQSYLFDNIHPTVNEVDKHSLYIEYTYQQMVLVSTSSIRKEENSPSINFTRQREVILTRINHTGGIL